MLGSVVGGLFKKTKYATTSFSTDQYGNVTTSTVGSNSATRNASSGAANSITQGLASIASALGATITGTPNITFGTYDGKYRVSTTGYTGKLKNGKPGVVDFGSDQQAAITFAIEQAVSRSVISGISAASVKIIQSGQDLQTAINKAITIESIPKQLLALTDPVRSAVQTINDTFKNTISILKEGGATAEQFAQAQQLYELQRENAIKQASQQAYGAIDDLITSLTAGSSSPLNKSQTLANARTALDPIAAQVRSGKLVDQNDLVSAVQDVLNGSRALNGSSTAYFSDYDSLLALLKQAKANAVGSSSNLPGSPFDTASVQTAITTGSGATVDAIRTQTQTLQKAIDNLSDAIFGANDNSGGGYQKNSSFGLLAGR